LGPDNKYSFRLVQKYVDDVILIAEDRIRAAMRWALREERLVIEGAAAVVVAHVLDQPAENDYGPTAAIITGDNVAPDSLSSAAQAIA
jgi:threonine dehydratase